MRSSRFLVFAVGLWFFFGMSTHVFARPGGGENYSGGGSYGGSYSGPSYGGSSGTYSGGSGEISLPAAIAIIVIIVAYSLLSSKKSSGRPPVIGNRTQQMHGLFQLQSYDPQFDLSLFLEKAKMIMSRLNEGWVENQMEPVRRFLSDGVYIRFQTQLHLLRSQGIRNFMDEWNVLGAEFLSADSDPLWDTIHVRMIGQARDVDVPLNATAEEAKRLAKQTNVVPYEEVWSFLRRKGRLSNNKGAAFEGRCPNCGANFPVSNSVKCDHCQAIVNSGEYDFVLAEITQPEEWSSTPFEQQIRGIELLTQRDPTVSRQEIEDRASVLFWKWIEARSTGRMEKLARFCLHPLSQPEYQAQLLLQHNTLTKVAVGSAELRQVITDVEGNRDQAWVEIRSSAVIEGNPTFMRHLFLLTRSNQAKSVRGLSFLDCPVCRGPLSESDATVCPYCAEKISGNKHDWALESVRLLETR